MTRTTPFSTSPAVSSTSSRSLYILCLCVCVCVCNQLLPHSHDALQYLTGGLIDIIQVVIACIYTYTRSSSMWVLPWSVGKEGESTPPGPYRARHPHHPGCHYITHIHTHKHTHTHTHSIIINIWCGRGGSESTAPGPYRRRHRRRLGWHPRCCCYFCNL